MNIDKTSVEERQIVTPAKYTAMVDAIIKCRSMSYQIQEKRIEYALSLLDEIYYNGWIGPVPGEEPDFTISELEKQRRERHKTFIPFHLREAEIPEPIKITHTILKETQHDNNQEETSRNEREENTFKDSSQTVIKKDSRKKTKASSES